jgi:hypothetical protein
MRTRSTSQIVPGLLVLAVATLVLAPPAAALDADYWRSGWRTPLGDERHIYEFVIRGNRVTARALLAGRTVEGAAAGRCRRHMDRCVVRPAGHEQADLHFPAGR